MEKKLEKKVVVTGLNLITSLGLDLQTSWDGLVAGKSGVKNISLFNVSDYSTQIAAELPEEFETFAKDNCKKNLARQMTRATKINYLCAKEAVRSSGIDFEQFDKSRCGVILGVVDTGYSVIDEQKSTKHRIIKSMPNAMAAWTALEYKLEGPSYTISTACSSSAFAIAQGYELISRNEADVVIVGGASSIVNPEHVGGFGDLFALSTLNESPDRASRPFSVDRDGFVIGEGGGILILESEESARARGAKIHAEIAGYGLTTEAYNIMAPMKDGIGMTKTMEKALKKAKVNKEDVDYINAHGTSTQLNDKYETMAIKRLLGDNAYNVAVSSNKSMTGHTVGAAGGIEAIATIMCIKNNILTPTINYSPDPELDLDYVPDKAKEREVNVALSNSFAFGGHNASLVIKKYI